MVLRYITGGKHRKNSSSLQQQTDDLLKAAISIIDQNDAGEYYEELLQVLQKYPSEVICSCHDHMGNTILHIMFSRRQPCDSNPNNNGKSKLACDTSTYRTTPRTSSRRGRTTKGNDLTERKVTLFQLVHYLLHCSDTTPLDLTNEEPIMGSDLIVDNPHLNSNPHCTSVARQKTAGGSLPLHMACRFRYTSEQQQIDIIQCIIDAYPYAVKCRDMWGNLPLHDACDVNSIDNIIPPIEIIILLIQIYPESVHVSNMDGNLPLHLIASTSKNTFTRLMKLDGTSKSTNNCQMEEMVEHDPKESTCKNESSHEVRQLEIVEYMVGYWPESVHVPNHRQQTALQQALEVDANAPLIEFLQSTVKQVDPPSATLASIALPKDQNSSDVDDADDADDILPNKTQMKPFNPFDDDCETLNTTMNLSVLSDEAVPDGQFPWNVMENINSANYENDHDNNDSEDSDSDFDGVVELAEDYFEIVVVDCGIDHDENQDQPIFSTNDMIESIDTQSDLCFNNNNNWTSRNFECVERFVTTFR